MVNLGKRDRKLTRLQMYMKHYYKVKWAKQCEVLWKEYEDNLPEGETKKARITFCNELCAKYLEE